MLCSCSFPLVLSAQFVGLKKSMAPSKSNAVTCASENTQSVELSPPHPYRMKANWRLWYLCIKIIRHTRAAAKRRGCKYCIKVISGLVPSLLHHMCVTFPVQTCSHLYFLPFLFCNLGKHVWREVPSSSFSSLPRGHFLIVLFPYVEFGWAELQLHLQFCEQGWHSVNSSGYGMTRVLAFLFMLRLGTFCCSRLMHAVTGLGRSSLRTTLLPRLQDWWRGITEWMGALS